MSDEKEKILVAMSGGVDSSVAAVLLLEQEYSVVGVFMKNWSGCDWEKDKRDAMRIAAKLGIDFYVYDFEKEYRERVYEYMIAEYEAGRTPNPDVMCNSEIKFDLLMKVADELGCSKMATGHYARVAIGDKGQVRLLKGVDSNKDQSYFLCRLGQDELKRAIFPVGELEKPQVRAIAEKRNLVTADKKDSQGLCFVGQVDIPTFLKERIKPKKGKIITTTGEVVGEHEGVQYYTIGQRHGLGVGGRDPLYVVERRLDTNELIVGHNNDPALYVSVLQADDLVWTSGDEPKLPIKLDAKIRYRQEDQKCKLSDGGWVKFDVDQRAVAPGQFIVFYDGDELVGSGVIK